jgi:predicted permease
MFDDITSAHIAFAFFLYMVGCQWTLIGMIIMDDGRSRVDTADTIKLILCWPMLWVFIVALFFAVGMTAILELLEDKIDDIRLMLRRKKEDW